MIPTKSARFRVCIGLAQSFAFAVMMAVWSTADAQAHPHVFIDARSEVVFDLQGRITAVRQIWRFDPAFSAFAIQGLDADNDGKLTVDELQPLAKVNVTSLKEFDFFTFLNVSSQDLVFNQPDEYWLDATDGQLTLFFTLPLKEPIATAGKPVVLDVFDPTYFVAFNLVGDQPVTLDTAPAGCTVKLEKAPELDQATASTLAEIPADVRDLPDELKDVTKTLANTAHIACP